jgi:hypothetical protein
MYKAMSLYNICYIQIHVLYVEEKVQMWASLIIWARDIIALYGATSVHETRKYIL